MALSMLSRTTLPLCRTFYGLSCSKTLLPAHSRCGLVFQTASYNPRPLKVNIKSPYIPDKGSEKTPEWQKTARYDGKLFGRYGAASGIEPASLWPSPGQLERLVAEEKEWQPPLDVMLENVRAKEKAESDKREAREKLIAANMAKMPKMISDWRKEKRDAKRKQAEEKSRRATLLATARERFGFAVDPRSPKFLEMVAEIEKEEKKKKKMMKRRLKEERTPPPPPPAASS